MLTITDDILAAANVTATELKQEIAVYLYTKNKLTFGQARRIAAMDVLQFQELLFNNGITLHYGISDLEDDAKSLGLPIKR